MEDPPATDNMEMEPGMEEAQPLMDAAPAAAGSKNSSKHDTTVDSKYNSKIDEADVCCCCICSCSTEETRHLSCFGCFPIKCGIISTGILTLLLILSSFIEIFYFILNDYIHWWFVLVAVCLLVPAIIGACFLVKFFNSDNHSSRGNVRTAYIFVIISYSTLAVWNIIYFNAWYKAGEVMAGGEQTGYYKLSKKQYLFWSLFITVIIDCFYAYFICVIAHYRSALKADEQKEKDAEAARQRPFTAKDEEKAM